MKRTLLILLFAFTLSITNAQSGVIVDQTNQVVYSSNDTVFGSVNSQLWELQNRVLKPLDENRFIQKNGILKIVNDSVLLFNDLSKLPFAGNVLQKENPFYEGISIYIDGTDTFSVFYIGDTVNSFQYYNDESILIINNKEMEEEVLYLSPDGTSFNNYGDVSFDVDTGNVSLHINKSGLCLPKLYEDPPAENGAMYYNDLTNEFRRCKNGIWETY